MNLANNHANDYGPSGQAQTLAALDRMMTARLRVELDGLLLSRTMAGYEAGRVGF